MIGVPFHKHVKPRLQHLKAHLNLLLDRYHEEHPYGERQWKAKLRVLKMRVNAAFQKTEEEFGELFGEAHFLRDVASSLKTKKGNRKRIRELGGNRKRKRRT